MTKTAKLKITLVKSMIGRLKAHKACVRGLGLRRIHESRVVDGTPENLGMIDKARYMLKVESPDG